LLNLGTAEGRLTLARYMPANDIGFFVEHYWIVRWDLRGCEPFTSESLPYPSVHVVLEGGRPRVQGVPTGRFLRTLRDQGLVFGIKFKPGGFHPFSGGPVSRLTDRFVPLAAILDYGPTLEAEVLAVSADDASMVERAEDLLRNHLPDRDDQIPVLASMVESVANDRSIVRVDQLVSQLGVGKRTLQRLFQEYVGVSPKWVIQRYRLFEAAERLAAGDADGTRVAHELGYFDQAHFIRDFKAMIGRSPLEFVRTLAGSA
jgi:AraC-like DNA-binding protein